MSLRSLLALGTLGAICCLAAPAQAFCRTMSCETNPRRPCIEQNGCNVGGANAHWPSACLSYVVQKDGSARLGIDAAQVDALLQEEFGRWSAATCTGGTSAAFSARSRGQVECNQVEYNCDHEGVNAVMFHDQSWPHHSVQIALTTVTMTVESGKILDADIEVNSAQHDLSLDPPSLENPNQRDLRMVIAHELGHFLGLAHSNDDAALMRDGGKPTPDLTADDAAGICGIYPHATEDPVCEAPPIRDGSCHGVKLACPQSEAEGGCTCRDAPASRSLSASLLLGAALAALLLGLSRRAGRRRAVTGSW